MVEDLLRLIIQPAIKKSAAVENPWLTIYKFAPDIPCDVIAKIPIVMNPKCEIDVKAINPLISYCPIAIKAP
jgi:hypothetical protein